MDAHPGDYKTAMASTAASHPRPPHDVLLLRRPRRQTRAAIHRACIVDEAPTMARMLGFDMPDVDGRALTELLV